MVYYEDFILDTENELGRVKNFLESKSGFKTTKWYSDFIGNLENHRITSTEQYETTHGKRGHGTGKKVIFHSLNYKFPIKKQIDEFIKNNYGLLWEKYLKRYGEDFRKRINDEDQKIINK